MKKKGFFTKAKMKTLEWWGLRLTPQEKAKITRRIMAEEKIALEEFHRQNKLKRVI